MEPHGGLDSEMSAKQEFSAKVSLDSIATFLEKDTTRLPLVKQEKTADGRGNLLPFLDNAVHTALTADQIIDGTATPLRRRMSPDCQYQTGATIQSNFVSIKQEPKEFARPVTPPKTSTNRSSQQVTANVITVATNKLDNLKQITTDKAELTAAQIIDGIVTPIRIPTNVIDCVKNGKDSTKAQSTDGDPKLVENTPLQSDQSSSKPEYDVNNHEKPAEKLNVAATLPLPMKIEEQSESRVDENVDDDIPENFFDDLLCDRPDGELEEGEIVSPQREPKQEPTEIPDNFFDDLLVDPVVVRAQEAINDELEVKYSKLRQLKKIKAKEKKKKSKQQKHKKKKSRRPSSSSSDERPVEYVTNRNHRKRPHTPTSERIDKKRTCIAQFPESILSLVRPSSINVTSIAPIGLTRRLQVKSEFRTLGSSLFEEQLECLPVVNTLPCFNTAILRPIRNTKIAEVSRKMLTGKEKRLLGLKRAAEAIEELGRVGANSERWLTEIKFNATVRKLKSSNSFMTQQIYENRSPLQNNNNVVYKFNSTSTHLKLKAWGLQSISTAVAQLICLLGFNVELLKLKQMEIKLPPKLLKLRQEAKTSVVKIEQGEAVEESRSSLYAHAMTQTDKVTVICGRHRKCYDIGTQTRIPQSSVGMQTCTDPNTDALENTYVLQMIERCNENQLLAIHEFSDILREKSETRSAVERYQQMKVLQEIYKTSKLASSLEGVVMLPSTYHNRDDDKRYMWGESTQNGGCSEWR